MSKPDVFLVISHDAPGKQHVAGAFRTYEEAKRARQQLARPDRESPYRTDWQYDIWQLPFGQHINPDPWP